MNWKRIPKENSSQPSTGTYKDWKELLSVEGFHQCVLYIVLFLRRNLVE